MFDLIASLPGTAFWVLGPRGTVLSANRAAEHVLGDSRLLYRTGEGTLASSLPEVMNLLAGSLAPCRNGRAAKSGVLELEGLRLSLSPLDGPKWQAGAAAIADDRLSAILELRPRLQRPSPEDWLMRLHGLTEAEAAVAVGFASGRTVEACATERGVSVATVQNQLRLVREKVGAPDRVELMRRLAPFLRY